MKLNNNDDSHNSGLNLLIYNMLLDIESHPAWVCGLKPPTVIVVLQPSGSDWMKLRTIGELAFSLMVSVMDSSAEYG